MVYFLYTNYTFICCIKCSYRFNYILCKSIGVFYIYKAEIEVLDCFKFAVFIVFLFFMFIVPHSVSDWLFGSGIYLFAIQKSDVGWINQLNYGGLFYLLLIIILFYYMMRRLFKIGYKPYALFFFLTVIIVNTKSILYPSIMEFNIFLFLYYSLIRNKLISSHTTQY